MNHNESTSVLEMRLGFRVLTEYYKCRDDLVHAGRRRFTTDYDIEMNLKRRTIVANSHFLLPLTASIRSVCLEFASCSIGTYIYRLWIQIS